MELVAVLGALRDFVLPVPHSVAAGNTFTKAWEPGQGWR